MEHDLFDALGRDAVVILLRKRVIDRLQFKMRTQFWALDDGVHLQVERVGVFGSWVLSQENIVG